MLGNLTRLTEILCAFCFLFSASSARGFDIKKPSSKEVFLGYGYGDYLKNKGEYTYNLLAGDLSYSFSETGIWRTFSFQLEPFISLVSSPETNGEIGCVFFIRYLVPWNFPLKPYARGGSGVICISQESLEQSTGINFASQVGYGLSYQLPNINIYLEYRNKHVSNWFMGPPNSGIDTYIWLLGIGGRF